jgi:multidrug resistance efflux pump
MNTGDPVGNPSEPQSKASVRPSTVGRPHDTWASLLSARTTGEFYASWLSMLCKSVASAEAGILLVRDKEGTYVPAATWPNTSLDATYLGTAVERVLRERTSVLLPDAREERSAGVAITRVHVAHPVLAGEELIALVAFDLRSPRQGDWHEALEKARWAAAWPEALYWRQAALAGTNSGRSAQLALDLISVADQHERFEAAAALVASALADRLDCARVSLGLSGRRGITVKAISHSASFDRKSALVSGLQEVMEEAFDQKAAVSVPATPATERRIGVAHADFLTRWAVGAIASVVITSSGHPIGVFTFERTHQAFDEETIQSCMSAVERIGSTLEAKHKQGHLISGRLAQRCKTAVSAVFGAGRPSLKIAALLAMLCLAALMYWPADFRIATKVALEGSVQRAAVAPFDGFIAEAPMRAGDEVEEGQVLARLDDRDLLLDKVKWEAERQKLIQKQREALAKHDRAAVQVTSAQIEQAESQLKLAVAKLERSHVKAPIGGMIVSGDLSRVLGTPVSQGKTLFEIAPLDAYRVVLQVDEHDISHLSLGQTGILLLTGAPGTPLQLTVTKLVGVATVEDGRNVFRAEASLADHAVPLRPGMEGLAKIDVGRRSLMWIWTRPMIERIRLLVWTWTP